MDKIDSLIRECKELEERATYNSETHFTTGARLSKKSFWYKVVPAAATVIGTILLITKTTPDWSAWVTLVTGALTLLSVLLDAEKRANDHILAGKSYTILKHDARRLYETYKEFISQGEFYAWVRQLAERYNTLAQTSPPTNNKDFEAARKRIQSGVHVADFRSGSTQFPTVTPMPPTTPLPPSATPPTPGATPPPSAPNAP